MLKSIEICAGAGGQALGLEMAGFKHIALVEYEKKYCETLKKNRPEWNIICEDVKNFSGKPYRNKIDLLAGGVPCPPFSVAGKQLGSDDERDLFPEALRLIEEINPKAVMLENVRGFLDPAFKDYRESILKRIDELGYNVQIKLLNASDYGVPQLRPRIVIVGIRKDVQGKFSYPLPTSEKVKTVGETLLDLMKKNQWQNANEWAKQASTIAPTIVGGSNIGNNYIVAPDIVIYRELEADEEINKMQLLVNDTVCKMADIRASNGGRPILHASISAKWTMRSDRAQNSRTEALGLIRNRKGHLPHIVVVTGEPMPGRLASLALGTGDIDCMYHFALYELIKAVEKSGAEDSIEMLHLLIEGKRIKDISDLPLDLAT